MSKDDGQQKKHPPTHRRLREARKQGSVVRSAEIVSAAVFIGVLAALWLGARPLAERLHGLLAYAVQLAAARDPEAEIMRCAILGLQQWALLAVVIMGIAGALGAAAAFFQVGGMVAWSRIAP